jgi:hypothetical protein
VLVRVADEHTAEESAFAPSPIPASALALASEIGPGFSPDTSRARRAPPLCQRRPCLSPASTPALPILLAGPRLSRHQTLSSSQAAPHLS